MGDDLDGERKQRVAALVARIVDGALPRPLELQRADLGGADFKFTNLSGANLSGANLSGACLKMADLTGSNLRGACLRGADLSGAYLDGADLTESNLRNADLGGAKLNDADLQSAQLSHATLRLALLNDAILRKACLNNAILQETFLFRADLGDADLGGAWLNGANLRGANLRGANLHETVLLGVELTSSMLDATGLANVTLDWRTVAKSLRLGDRLLPLLLRTGMPDVVATYLIDSLKSIDETDLFTMLQSVFLSYGRPDEAFATRLRKELTANGVKTWFFPKDATPGARLHRHIQKQIGTYDRMILCCSKASLQRKGVLHEIEEVLEREQSEGGSEVMIPIMLTDVFGADGKPPSWWPEGKEHVYLAISRRVAADFRKAWDDPDVWVEQLGRLLVALRKNPAAGVSTA